MFTHYKQKTNILSNGKLLKLKSIFLLNVKNNLRHTKSLDRLRSYLLKYIGKFHVTFLTL